MQNIERILHGMKAFAKKVKKLWYTILKTVYGERLQYSS